MIGLCQFADVLVTKPCNVTLLQFLAEEETLTEATVCFEKIPDDISFTLIVVESLNIVTVVILLIHIHTSLEA